jgi:undecaprenyl-diphosphatase
MLTFLRTFPLRTSRLGSSSRFADTLPMPILHLFLVAIIQGLTEFLPVSSSGHLILLPNLSGLEDQGLTIDVAVHVGTLAAVILYFRTDVARALNGVPKVLRWQIEDQNAWLALCLGIATVPVIVAGPRGEADRARRTDALHAVIGWTMLIFGLVLWWADRKAPRHAPPRAGR